MATLESVSKEIKRQLALTSKIGRAVASDLHTLTRIRIFEDGKATNGKPLGTYKESTIKRKKRKGRFTSSKVNLRDTEKLANSYIFSTKGKNDYVLGFAEISRPRTPNSKIIKYLEEQYGQIFQITTSEAQGIDASIEDFLDRIYK